MHTSRKFATGVALEGVGPTVSEKRTLSSRADSGLVVDASTTDRDDEAVFAGRLFAVGRRE